MSTDEIKSTVVNDYVHGAFNETNIEAFREIFHQQFAIANPQDDGTLFFFTREMWQNVLEKRKANPDFDYSTIALTPKFRMIDEEKERAAVTLDLYLLDRVIYTDFLLLIKTAGNWKVVSKVYHEHK
jgi:hypothetical protein